MSDFEDIDNTFHLTAKGFEKLHSGEIEDFTDDQLLILRFADGREKRERDDPTEDEIGQIINWYDKIMMETALLDMVLKGICYIDLNDDGEPTFSLTEEGVKHAKKMGL